jgi:hypothetical protein
MTNAQRLSAACLAVSLASAFAFTAPVSAKTCKAEIQAKGVATGVVADKREARARSSALSKWRAKVQSRHGVAYRFWSRADDKKIDCSKSKDMTRCTVSAKPCRLL